jgi:hypothetical protein
LRPETGRSALAISLALAVHGIAIGTIAQRFVAPGSKEARVAPPENETDVTLETIAAPGESIAAVASAANVPSSSSRGRIEPSPSRGATSPQAELGVSDEPAASPGEGFTFRPTIVDLRLSAAAAAGAIPAPEAPPASGPRPISTTGGLAEGLDAADVERGLGRGGPARAAVEEAARSSEAPMFGIAMFAVSVDGAGKVAVDVLDATSERAGWEALRPAIADRLAKAPVRPPSGSRGLRVTVRVEASEQFPGGARPPAKEGVVAKASPGKITETKTKIDIELPYAAIGYRGRRCGGGLVIAPGGISGGAGCEVGVPLRVVATRIVSEQRL